ncbi:CHAP domain-containing protein [Intrasporangium sp.]|uniref:CHAP domain-containing protein n=1 Tax=Intrasporangium sp. TaxID=1925024 RepID=UPI0033657440
MNTDTRPGRHRTPGGYSPLLELKNIARESAQPAMKGAAVVAAAGGLVATLSSPASAETITDTSAVVAAPKVAAPKAAAAVGPDAATAPALALAPALSSIGYTAPAPKKAAKPKPLVIKDLVVERKEAAAKKAAADKAAAAKAAAARDAAARASRSSSRTSLTTPTYTQKSAVNATTGKKSAYNWATAGQCTWGALNKWYQSEGYYPGGWTGNAMEWAWGAANAGYTVSGTPRTRSILVMQPGVHGSSSVGHVAWVTAVNGNEVTIVEMNALAGAYNYNTRTVTDMSGMKYIYAP